jgi:hypothetical protein
VAPFEILWEPLLPAAWLAASSLMAMHGHYGIALGLSFLFFADGSAGHPQRLSLGAGTLSRRLADLVLWIMSVLMLGLMHAVQFHHLWHHRLTRGRATSKALVIETTIL